MPRSTNGIRTTRPGPFVARSRPSRNTTSRWYSRDDLDRVEQEQSTTITNTTTTPMSSGDLHQVVPPSPRRARHAAARLVLGVDRFDGEHEPVDGLVTRMRAPGESGPDGDDRLPLLGRHAHQAAVRIDAQRRDARRRVPTTASAPCARRHPPMRIALATTKPKNRRDDRRREDEHQRRDLDAAGAVVEEPAAEHKADRGRPRPRCRAPAPQLDQNSTTARDEQHEADDRDGQQPKANSESTSMIVPTVPENTWPGISSSSTMSARPSQKNRNARLGSNRPWRKPEEPADWPFVDGGARRSRASRRVPLASVTVVPSSLAEELRRAVGAIRSITPAVERLLRGDARGLGDERLGQGLGVAIVGLGERSGSTPRRPRRSSSTRSPPSRPTGVEAPTFVPGAIAATGQRSRMNAPAEAARAPCGAT